MVQLDEILPCSGYVINGADKGCRQRDKGECDSPLGPALSIVDWPVLAIPSQQPVDVAAAPIAPASIERLKKVVHLSQYVEVLWALSQDPFDFLLKLRASRFVRRIKAAQARMH